MKNAFLFFITFCSFFSAPVVADDLLTASKDISCRPFTAPTGDNTTMVVRKETASSGFNHTIGILQFEFLPSEATGDATLFLDVAEWNAYSTNLSSSYTFKVWGLVDGSSYEDFDESSGIFTNFQGLLDHSGDGLNNGSSALSGGLGTFKVSPSDVGTTISFTSTSLTQLVADDTDGIVTLLITSYHNTDNLEVSFATRENDTYNAPSLFVEMAEELVDASGDGYVRLGDGSGNYSSDDEILVKRAKGGSGGSTRKAIIYFDNVYDGTVKDASLLLDLVNLGGSGNTSINVWGVSDDSGIEDMNESAMWYSHYSSWAFGLEVFNSSSDGVANSSSHLANSGEKLGTIEISSSDVGSTVSFTSTEFINFINEDTDNRIMVFLTATENDETATFASSESNTYNAPRLALNHALEESSSLDVELAFIDVDNDNDRDMTLVVQVPGSGSFYTADPFVIADFLIQSDFGVGIDEDFFQALSTTQKASMRTTLNSLDASTPSSGDISASFIRTTITNEAASSREYYINFTTSSSTFTVDLEDGVLTASVYDRTVSSANGNVSVGVTAMNTQAGMSVSDGGMSFGSSVTYVGVSGTVGNTNGTYIGASASIGEGYFFDAKWDGQYGLSTSIPGTPFGVAIYVKGSDAVYVYNSFKSWVNNSANDAQVWFQGAATSTLNFADDSLVYINNRFKDTKVFIKKTGNTAYVWIEDTGEKVFAYIEGTASEVEDALLDLENKIATAGQATGAFIDDALDWVGDSAGVVTGAWYDAEGWIVGSANTVGNWFENIFGL